MQSKRNGLQLWGGLECTINRVGDTYMDQMQRSGHYGRPADFDAIAALGIHTLRYGLHWERFCQEGSLEVFAEPLRQMERLGIAPIAGLVHHGSGPTDTNLLDPAFPEKLADYALCLANRFPELNLYTPVNEPQTTARFSGLYGHWYPHHRSIPSYLRALVNQLKATVLAMQAIRSVRPEAQFISTEDGGKTWYTPALQEVGEERTLRRWLGLDLLCGRVDHRHPTFQFLCRHGIAESEVLWFLEHPCPPDIIGLNYYLTSDRFLDHRTGNYRTAMVGGDTGHEPLVDVEALRVRQDGIAGAGLILREAWDRYRLPVAITECHLGGEPEDQVRWLVEVWQQAEAARAGGADIRAITLWAMLGSFDWDSLVTLDRGHYEPGAFDIRSGLPVATPLAFAAQSLTRGEVPGIQGDAWWRASARFTFPAGTEA